MAKPPAGFQVVDAPPGPPSGRPPEGFSIIGDRSEIKQDYPYRRAFSKYLLHPAVEGTAMTLGGMAAAPTAPATFGLGPIAAAAAMYPPAHELANGLDDYMGIGHKQKPVSDLQRVLGEMGTGTAIELGGRAAGMGIQKGLDLAVRGGVPVFLGPSREAVTARIERPDAIKNAPSFTAQAERLPTILGNIKTAISAASEKANSFLRSSPAPEAGAVPVSKLTGILNGLQDRLKVGAATIGASDKAGAAKMESLANDLNQIIPRNTPAPILGPRGEPIVINQAEAYIPETALKKAIQRIRQDINFSDKGATTTNSLLTDVSGQLDGMLKAGNPAYQKSMRPVNVLMKLYDNAQNKFNITRNTGEGLQPTDATISSLKALPSERRGMSQKIADRIKMLTGADITRASKDRQLADQFVGGNAQGTRRTAGGAVIGSAIGAGVGHMAGAPAAGASIGSTAGAIAGMASDVSGRETGAHIVDAYVKAMPWLAKLPYEVITRLISSGAIANKEQQQP